MIPHLVGLSTGDWLSWSGWGFIATVAQVVSLAALVFAIHELIARARAVPNAFVLHHFGYVDAQGDVPAMHMVEVMNIGHSLAVINEMRVVNAVLAKDPNYRVKYALLPGEVMTVGLICDDPAKVWIRFQWVGPDDRRYVHGVWRVLWAGTPLEEVWIEANHRTPSRRWWSTPVRTRRPRPIGPGRDVATRVRITWDVARHAKRMARAFPVLVEQNEAWSLGAPQVLPSHLSPTND